MPKCPECGLWNSDKNEKCRGCGHNIEKGQSDLRDFPKEVRTDA